MYFNINSIYAGHLCKTASGSDTKVTVSYRFHCSSVKAGPVHARLAYTQMWPHAGITHVHHFNAKTSTLSLTS